MKTWCTAGGLALTLLTGCGGDGGCEPYVAQTASITINDAVTGLPIACGATVTIGQWTAPFLDGESCDDATTITPHRGSGTYELLITKPGYADWTMTITATALNRCGTITEPAVVEAFLNPLP